MRVPTAQLVVLLALDMLGALFPVHAPAGIFSDQRGYALVLVLAVSANVVALLGGGRLAIDALVFGRSRKGTLAALAERLPPTTLDKT
jgi:putative oxidoreductase